MKFTVLCDNYTTLHKPLLAEPGFSMYIEDGDEKILFDTGYSDVFLRNAAFLGIDLPLVDKIVISHGHDDHTGGLKYLFRKVPTKHIEVHAHPSAFRPKMKDGKSFGSPYGTDDLKSRCTLMLSKEPVKLTENLTFLGEIPTYPDLEKRYTLGFCEDFADMLYDDTALVYSGNDGLTILTGCSHSGITNICEYAKYVTGVDKIHCVAGGFHIREKGEKLDIVCNYFKKEKIDILLPCHCTCLDAKIALSGVAKVGEVGSGFCFEVE